MVNNGTLHYDHDRDGTHTELSGCQSHFRKARHETYLAVRYELGRLSVGVVSELINLGEKPKLQISMMLGCPSCIRL